MSSLIADCFSSFYSVDTIFWTVKMRHIFSRAVLGYSIHWFSAVFASGQSPTGKISGGYLQAATLNFSCIVLFAHLLKIHLQINRNPLILFGRRDRILHHSLRNTNHEHAVGVTDALSAAVTVRIPAAGRETVRRRRRKPDISSRQHPVRIPDAVRADGTPDRCGPSRSEACPA